MISCVKISMSLSIGVACNNWLCLNSEQNFTKNFIRVFGDAYKKKLSLKITYTLSLEETTDR